MRLLADLRRYVGEPLRRDREAPAGDHIGGGLGRRADQRRRAVHREIDAGLQHAGGAKRHDRDEGLHQHRAIADEGNLRLVADHLGRRARRHQRVKARHRAAGDGDEQEGKQTAGEHRPRAVDEAADRRHFQIRPDDENADGQRGDRADLEEGREIVARRQQQPHRQHRGDEAIGDQHEGQRLALEGEQRRQSLALRDIAPQREAGDQQHEADQRHLEDTAGAQIAPIDTHENRDRQCRENGEGAPGTVGQRLDDDEAEHGEQNDHDRENAEHRDEPRDFAHLGFDEIAERAAVAARRNEQDEHVLHRAGEDDADHQPQRAGEITHLRGEHGSDQRAGAGDGREMMAEQHVFVGRHVIEPVVAAMRRRRAIGVEPQQLSRDEQTHKSDSRSDRRRRRR